MFLHHDIGNKSTVPVKTFKTLLVALFFCFYLFIYLFIFCITYTYINYNSKTATYSNYSTILGGLGDDNN